MKKILKLYKMFYRLLRLKDWQRREIETHIRAEYSRKLACTYKEYFAAKTELNNYKNVMRKYGINSQIELLKVLEGAPIVCNSSKTEILMLNALLEQQYRSQATNNSLSEDKCSSRRT